MPTTQYKYLLHSEGPALWPAHKPLKEVLELKATTPALIWEGTFQGNPTAAGGHLFERVWFTNNRFELPLPITDFLSQCVARYISFDTAFKDTTTSAYTACTVGELMPDYRMRTMEVWRDRVTMPNLLKIIKQKRDEWNRDGMLNAVIIEDKASGTSAYQTLMAEGDEEMQQLLVAFTPTSDKDTRCQQAAVWCANGSVILPKPSIYCPWLVDFESELFSIPNSSFRDMGDAFAQMILWVEHLLAEGFHQRMLMLGRDE